MAACVACNRPLILELEEEEEDVSMGGSSGKAPAAAPESVPDDLHLNCGCHFHWDCLLEAYQITQCPNCGKDLTSTSSTGQQQVLCNLNNEGGLQEALDILPLLTEEAYLRAYPDDRKCRAFLEFCREGDFKAVIEMLQDDDEDEDEDDEMDTGEEELPRRKVSNDDLLRYQDPIGDMQSGLHAAVQAGSRETAWLLLLLASNFDLTQFPPEVFQEAEALGVMREEQAGKTDIRSLKDSNGKSAEDIAREAGPVWSDWIGTGRLTV